MIRFDGRMLTLLAATIFVFGCGQSSEKPSTTDTNPAATTGSEPAAPPPASTSASGWQEIRQGETDLKAAIEAGQLNQVHGMAVALQSKLKGVVGLATELPADQRGQLQQRVEAAGRLVDSLHDSADGGDLTKTKAEFAKFEVELHAIEGLLGASAK